MAEITVRGVRVLAFLQAVQCIGSDADATIPEYPVDVHGTTGRQEETYHRAAGTFKSSSRFNKKGNYLQTTVVVGARAKRRGLRTESAFLFKSCGSSYPLRDASKVGIVPMLVVNRTELEKQFETTHLNA